VTAPTRLKAVLPDGVGVNDLYELAERHRVQLRRVNFRRDSLEDIFLNAMEAEPPAATKDETEEAADGRL
jgi:hypothetical protein